MQNIDELIAFAAFITTMLLFLYIISRRFASKKSQEVSPQQAPPIVEPPIPPEIIEQQDQYINTLPRNTDCEDEFTDCAIWAQNGECMINPEYMLYHCKKSCQACGISPEERFNVVKIVNSRPPDSCVYHGSSYPNPLDYNIQLANY